MSIHVVGIGGTTRPNSSTERALRVALASAEAAGATATLFSGEDLAELPMYAPEKPERADVAQRLIAELRRADGVIIGSPAYHGSISGLVKNALDYTEDMREDDRVYLTGRACGVIATGYGWQGVVATLHTLRQIVHALRGYPTPLGAGINSLETRLGDDGTVSDEKAAFQLATVGREVVELATQMRRDLITA
jgi:FMN reductase